MAGFFVLFSRASFRTNVYSVLEHAIWAKRNPGKCATKIEMPWSAEGPLLGRELHAISGGRVKFRPEQIEYLKFNLTDEEIKQGFRRLLARGVPMDGHGFLRIAKLCLFASSFQQAVAATGQFIRHQTGKEIDRSHRFDLSLL
jgi:hypothetical protein